MSEGAAAPAAAPAAPQNGAPRNNAGQFAPKAGATGVAPQEGAAPTQGGQENAPPSGPQSLEDWKAQEFEVDVYGEKQKVKWGSKAEAQRAAQELLAYRKRVRDISAAEQRMRSLEAMPPRERAKALGVPLHDIAREEVLEAAKLLDMTDEQRDAYNDRKELQRLRGEREETQKKQQLAEKQQAARAMRERAVAGLEKGLELSGLPKTHHTMALLAEIQHEATSNGMPELPPDLLAAEANKRYGERGVEPLKKLQGKALLDRIGPDLTRAVLLAVREQRGLAAGQPHQAASSPITRETPQGGEKIYGEAEAEVLLREMRNRR